MATDIETMFDLLESGCEGVAAEMRLRALADAPQEEWARVLVDLAEERETQLDALRVLREAVARAVRPTDRVGVTSEEIDAIAGKLEDAIEHISHGGHRGDARLAVLEAQHLVEDLGSRAVELVNEQLLAALHAWVRADTNGITPTEGKRLRELTRAAIDAAERAPKADYASWLRGRIELHEATARHLEEQEMVAYVIAQLSADAGIGGEFTADLLAEIRRVVTARGENTAQALAGVIR